MIIFLPYRALNRNGQTTINNQLRKSFGDMDMLKQRDAFEKLLRGMVSQQVEKADSNFVDDVRI